MLKRFLHFIQYNNAFTLILFALFAGGTVTFAANPDARSAVYASTEKIVSVDNTYLLSQNIEQYPFEIKVLSVREDTEKYYIDYSYKTIEVKDYVWKDVIKTGTLTPSKKELLGKDLGLYTEEQLGQIVGAQRADLLAAQTQERKLGVSVKVATVEYSGLIGRVLDATTKEFPGYQPIVDETPKPEEKEELAAYLRNGKPYARDTGDGAVTDISSQVADALSQSKNEASIAAALGPGFPVLHINGKTPALLDVGQTYADLGATVEDDKDKDLTIQVKGAEIDTSKAGEFTVTYSVTDSDNQTSTATRKIIVSDPFASQHESPTIETPPAAEPTPAITPEQAPAAVPEPTPVPEPTAAVTPEQAPAPTPTPAPEPAPAPSTVQSSSGSTTESATTTP